MVWCVWCDYVLSIDRLCGSVCLNIVSMCCVVFGGSVIVWCMVVVIWIIISFVNVLCCVCVVLGVIFVSVFVNSLVRNLLFV